MVSSRYEGFGNVLIEAMSLGTPVLSTDCGGPSEILSNFMKNCLVPNGNVKMLAKKMSAFYYNPPQIDKNAFQHFEASRIANEYLKLIPEK